MIRWKTTFIDENKDNWKRDRIQREKEEKSRQAWENKSREEKIQSIKEGWQDGEMTRYEKWQRYRNAGGRVELSPSVALQSQQDTIGIVELSPSVAVHSQHSEICQDQDVSSELSRRVAQPSQQQVEMRQDQDTVVCGGGVELCQGVNPSVELTSQQAEASNCQPGEEKTVGTVESEVIVKDKQSVELHSQQIVMCQEQDVRSELSPRVELQSQQKVEMRQVQDDEVCGGDVEPRQGVNPSVALHRQQERT